MPYAFDAILFFCCTNLNLFKLSTSTPSVTLDCFYIIPQSSCVVGDFVEFLLTCPGLFSPNSLRNASFSAQLISGIQITPSSGKVPRSSRYTFLHSPLPSTSNSIAV